MHLVSHVVIALVNFSNPIPFRAENVTCHFIVQLYCLFFGEGGGDEDDYEEDNDVMP
jgi:hypothetical protein